MRREVLFASVVGLAAGVGLVAALSLRVGGGAVAVDHAAPDVARVVCGAEDVLIEAPAVRAGEAGVRFVVENDSGARLLLVRPLRRQGRDVELLLSNGTFSEATLLVAPGSVQVSCLRDRMSGEAPASELVIVDPHHLWISPELACTRFEEREFQTRFAGQESASETILRTIPGLVDGDELATPGYPGTKWHGDMVAITRDGRTIGRVTRAQDQGMWTVALTACAGSDLVSR